MTSKVKTLVLAGLISLPFVANAQPAAKDWEIILGGNGQATTEFRRDNAGNPGGQFGATLSLGYYINDNLEIALRQSLGYATSGSWTGYTRAAVDYNFLMDKFVPFLGVNIGYSYANRGRTDSWAAAPEAGIKYYLQDKAFLFGMGEYAVPFRGKGPWDDGTWVFTLGLGINL
jgi:hypothetical protein